MFVALRVLRKGFLKGFPSGNPFSSKEKGDFMKKIISLIVAIIIIFSFLAVPFVVSADDETGMTNQEYYAAQSYLVAKYKDGDISYSVFQQRSQAVTDEFVSKNTVGGVLQSGALNASNTFNAVSQKIGDTVQKYGDSAREHISDCVSDFFNDYIKLSNEPVFDMQGNGCVLVQPFSNAGNGKIDRYRVLYGEYGLIKKVGDEIHYSIYNVSKRDIYDLNWNFKYSQGGTSVTSMAMRTDMKRYGDWRFESGESADTDDEFQTISDYDFSEAPERELEDLLKKILNEFELQQPDLSSIEGLLNAIYARLGTLDSDNDNELLSSLNSAILALVKSNDDNSEALLTELLKFREDLKNGTVGSDSSSHGHEISGTLYNVIPLDKNWLNKIFHDKENLKVQYEGKTYYLEDCGCLKLDDKFYSVDINYSSQIDVDYDFGFDSSELNFLIKDDQKFYDIDFDTLNDLYSKFQSNGNSQTYSMRKTRKAVSSVQNELQEKFSNYLTDQQVNNASIVSSMIEKFVAAGVPFEDIKKNFSIFEDILFNNYTPRDIVITYPYGHSYASFTILSYKWFNGGDSGVSSEHEGSSGDIHGGGGGSFGNGGNDSDNGSSNKIDSKTENFSKYSKIVRAFTSILISFSWLLSMYKKMSSLI